MKDLTIRQREVLGFIRSYIGDHAYPPTLREIVVHFGWLSTQAAADHVTAIERKGFVAIDRHVARGIRVVGVQGVTRSVKIEGAVDAIRTLRRAYFRVGVKLSAANEPLFIAAVRKVLEVAL